MEQQNGDGDPKPLATGTLTLHDPSPGTADEVVLVCRCGDLLFYVMSTDPVTKTSNTEFMLMLPENGIVIDLSECSDKDLLLHMEGVLAARTKFHDETKQSATGDYPENLPDDCASRFMFRTSAKVAQLTVRASKVGASKIDAYGEKKREAVTEGKDVKVGRTSITVAKTTRTVAEKTSKVATSVSEKVSDALGGKVGKAAAIKESDSATKRRARSLLLASTISYGEISYGAAEGYELMVKSAQAQATSFVAKKYGKEAAELARHTAGAAANFGRAALTLQRVVNVKKLVKSAGKQMVKEGIKGSL